MWKLLLKVTRELKAVDVLFLAAVRRLLAVPAGRPAAEEPAEPASGGG